ncbi:hypothetical protein LIER_06447 [Lithospermum erythrorhizon]|uniref:Uncharacterized protein n=1 Tax=Lithospermum erythrorhizon TaxID=34254 RepID=A0AAV3P4L5_LITER
MKEPAKVDKLEPIIVQKQTSVDENLNVLVSNDHEGEDLIVENSSSTLRFEHPKTETQNKDVAHEQLEKIAHIASLQEDNTVIDGFITPEKKTDAPTATTYATTKRTPSSWAASVAKVEEQAKQQAGQLPPDVDFMFPNNEGIENGINHYHEVGYKLLARRSLSPTGRSSPKLVSLHKR